MRGGKAPSWSPPTRLLLLGREIKKKTKNISKKLENMRVGFHKVKGILNIISLKPKKSFHVHFEDIPIWVFATEMINTVPSFIKDPQATGSSLRSKLKCRFRLRCRYFIILKTAARQQTERRAASHVGLEASQFSQLS